jgi:transposase-like protein
MGRCEELRAVVIVLDEARVERDLAAAAIGCPSCSSGRLRPWGYARTRVLRCLGGVRRIVRPRRARCAGCAATHVLLPADTLPRHADTVQVVVAALLASHAGTGARTIAADLGVPVDTVRSWLRRVTGRADAVQTQATRWGHRYDPELMGTPTTGSVLGDVVSALGVAARAIRLGSETTATAWQLIGIITGGRLVWPLPMRSD